MEQSKSSSSESTSSSEQSRLSFLLSAQDLYDQLNCPYSASEIEENLSSAQYIVLVTNLFQAHLAQQLYLSELKRLETTSIASFQNYTSRDQQAGVCYLKLYVMWQSANTVKYPVPTHIYDQSTDKSNQLNRYNNDNTNHDHDSNAKVLHLECNCCFPDTSFEHKETRIELPFVERIAPIGMFLCSKDLEILGEILHHLDNCFYNGRYRKKEVRLQTIVYRSSSVQSDTHLTVKQATGEREKVWLFLLNKKREIIGRLLEETNGKEIARQCFEIHKMPMSFSDAVSSRKRYFTDLTRDTNETEQLDSRVKRSCCREHRNTNHSVVADVPMQFEACETYESEFFPSCKIHENSNHNCDCLQRSKKENDLVNTNRTPNRTLKYPSIEKPVTVRIQPVRGLEVAWNEQNQLLGFTPSEASCNVGLPRYQFTPLSETWKEMCERLTIPYVFTEPIPKNVVKTLKRVFQETQKEYRLQDQLAIDAAEALEASELIKCSRTI